jgi:hypothetical protein
VLPACLAPTPKPNTQTPLPTNTFDSSNDFTLKS